MSRLTPEQVADHQIVRDRQVSGPQRGPYALFTLEELQVIKRFIPIEFAIIHSKVKAAIEADPCFRQPFV